MALDPSVQVRRIKAAIALAGLTQQEFSDAIEELGVNRSALGLMVRADRVPPPKQKIPPMDHATAVCMGEVANVPPEWFTEPDLAKLFKQSTDGQFVTREEMDDLKRELQAMRDDPPPEPDEAGGA